MLIKDDGEYTRREDRGSYMETVPLIHYAYTILQKLLNFKHFSALSRFFVNYVYIYVNTVMSTPVTGVIRMFYHFALLPKI